MAAVTADTPPSVLPRSHDPSAPQPSTNNPQPRDDLDSLFNFSDDPAPAGAGRETAARPSNNASRADGGADALGIDSEVKIRKARAPVAKLDEALLLSHKGIPSLRARIAKAVPRSERSQHGSQARRGHGGGKTLRGTKGAEFADVQALLQLYQLWLDDMFPKARFRDALELVEKLGHKRRVQVARREWIDEGKPRPYRESEDEQHAGLDRDGEPDAMDEDDDFVVRGDGAAADEDDMYAAPTPQPEQRPSQRQDVSPRAHDAPDEDELDVLLADDALSNNARANQHSTARTTGDKSAAEGSGQNQAQLQPQAQGHGQVQNQQQDQSHSHGHGDDDFDDDMEAMAELGF